MKSWPCRGVGRGPSSPTWGAPASPSWCASTMRGACLTPRPVRCLSPRSTHTGRCRLAGLCLYMQRGKATCMSRHMSVHLDVAISSAASLLAVCVLPSCCGCCKLLQCLEQECRDQGASMALRPLAGCTAALELSSALGCSSLWTWASFSCACSRSRSQQVGADLQSATDACSALLCSLADHLFVHRLTCSVVLPALHGVV